MEYTIEFKPKAIQDLDSLQPEIAKRIVEKISRLSPNLEGDVPEILKKNGRNEFAVLPYEEYLAITEALADYEDLQDLRAAKAEEGNAAPCL